MKTRRRSSKEKCLLSLTEKVVQAKKKIVEAKWKSIGTKERREILETEWKLV